MDAPALYAAAKERSGIFRLTFAESVGLSFGPRSFEEKTTHDLALFVSSSGTLAYARPRAKVRTGRTLSDAILGHLLSAESVDREAALPHASVLDMAKKVKRLLAPGAWQDLADAPLPPDLPATFETYKTLSDDPVLRVWSFLCENKRGLRITNVRRTMHDFDIPLIARALAERRDFSAHASNGRDYSVEVKRQDDGTIKAWYSSEYRGCGNGDYYLLLNPTTAVFCERD